MTAAAKNIFGKNGNCEVIELRPLKVYSRPNPQYFLEPDGNGTCKGCLVQCEYGYLDDQPCIHHPELFVSQR